jgi:hypothetical protein
MIDRAARKHAVDILANSHGIVDAQEIERVLVWYEEQIGIAHDIRSLDELYLRRNEPVDVIRPE